MLQSLHRFDLRQISFCHEASLIHQAGHLPYLRLSLYSYEDQLTLQRLLLIFHCLHPKRLQIVLQVIDSVVSYFFVYNYREDCFGLLDRVVTLSFSHIQGDLIQWLKYVFLIMHQYFLRL